MHKRALLAVLALAFMAAPVHGQGLSSEITVTAETPAMIAWNGTGPLNVSVEIGCGIFLNDPSASSVTVTAMSENDTIMASEESIAISGTDCIAGAGTVSGTATITLTPSETAPAIVGIPMNVTATVGDASGTTDVTATVSYHAAHEIITDVAFPLTVDGGSATFNVTLVFAGNAPTMIMFEEQSLDNGGSVKGLKPIIETPPMEVTIPVTFTAPSGDWNQTTLSFRNFSHYIFTGTGTAGAPELETIMEWTFVQGESPTTQTPDEDKDSPSVGLLAGIGLLAAAFLARRK